MEGENLLQLSSDLHVHFTTHEYPFMCTKYIKRHNEFHEVTISKKQSLNITKLGIKTVKLTGCGGACL